MHICLYTYLPSIICTGILVRMSISYFIYTHYASPHSQGCGRHAWIPQSTGILVAISYCEKQLHPLCFFTAYLGMWQTCIDTPKPHLKIHIGINSSIPVQYVFTCELHMVITQSFIMPYHYKKGRFFYNISEKRVSASQQCNYWKGVCRICH